MEPAKARGPARVPLSTTPLWPPAPSPRWPPGLRKCIQETALAGRACAARLPGLGSGRLREFPLAVGRCRRRRRVSAVPGSAWEAGCRRTPRDGAHSDDQGRRQGPRAGSPWRGAGASPRRASPPLAQHCLGQHRLLQFLGFRYLT